MTKYISEILAFLSQVKHSLKIAITGAIIVLILAFLVPLFKGGRAAFDADLQKGRVHLAASSHKATATPVVSKPKPSAKPRKPRKKARSNPKPKRGHTVRVLPSGEVIVAVYGH